MVAVCGIRSIFPVFRWWPLLAVAGGLVSCDTPEKRALRELSKQGVEISGRSLVEAVGNGDTRRAGLLLEAGVHPEQVDEKGRTPLRIALENKNLPLVFHLIDAGVDVNAAAPDGSSVLAAAVESGETAVAERLIAHGAGADGLMASGEKILPWAIRHGRTAAVRTMLQAGADPHLADREGNQLLHLAMKTGRRDIAEDLIALGADPAATGAHGATTIHLALQQDWLDLIPGLASSGADLNLPSPGSPTPLQAAASAGRADQVETLLAAGADPHLTAPGFSDSPLDLALTGGKSALLDAFLRHGIRPDAARASAAIREMMDSRDLAGARLLLSHGTNSFARGPGGLLPVEAAVARGQGSFAKLLLDYGQPAGAALLIASKNGDARMVKLLLTCGVHPNSIPPPALDTPLAAAIRNRHDFIASLLIRNGANPRLRLPEGQTPLHLAIVTGCVQTAGDLLDAGADPNLPFTHPVAPVFIDSARAGVIRWALRSDRNVTPLMVAADSGDLDLARKLIDAGAKKSVWTRSARLWPINFASRRSDIKMMRLMLGRDPGREERHIVVSLSEQKAWMYDGDGNEIFSSRVSTGKKGKRTPTGEFVITNKHRHWTSTIYDSSMPYFQRLSCSDFGLHQGHVPGYPASSGCIRLPAASAAKLFSMTQAGDRVRIDP